MVFQGWATDPLHHQVEQSAIPVEVKHRHDAGMVQLLGAGSLPLQPNPGLRHAPQIQAQYLDGHIGMCRTHLHLPQVTGFEHPGCSAAPYQLIQHIALVKRTPHQLVGCAWLEAFSPLSLSDLQTGQQSLIGVERLQFLFNRHPCPNLSQPAPSFQPGQPPPSNYPARLLSTPDQKGPARSFLDPPIPSTGQFPRGSTPDTPHHCTAARRPRASPGRFAPPVARLALTRWPGLTHGPESPLAPGYAPQPTTVAPGYDPALPVIAAAGATHTADCRRPKYRHSDQQPTAMQ